MGSSLVELVCAVLFRMGIKNVSIFSTGGGRGQFEEDAADGARNSQWDVQRQQHQNT